MVEKTEKPDFFSRQNCQKSGKNPAKTAQNPSKMTEKRRQNTGGGHPLSIAGRRRGAACPASSSGGRGIIGPARPVRGDLSSGAWCCCPLLYSYVWRGGVRSPTGGASSARRAGQCGGIIGPARGGPVLYSEVGRGRGWYGAGGAAVWCRCEVWPVWAAVWGCCPLLYSYVGRGGVRSPTGAGIIGPARGVGVA